jgi:tetratricopeptide (TPR) repeat protein
MAPTNRPPSGRNGPGSRKGSGPGSRAGKGGSGSSSGAPKRGGPKRSGAGAPKRASSSGRPGESRSGRPGSKPGDRSSGGAPRKYTRSAPKPDRRDDDDDSIPGNREWGGLARKGVLRANHDERLMDERKAEADNEPVDEEAEAKREDRANKHAERELRQADLREQARDAVERANKGKARPARTRKPRAKKAFDRAPLPAGPARNEDEVEALNRLLGAAEAKKQLRKLRSAAESFEAERYGDAKKSLKAVAELAPSVAEVRELYGLTMYRMGQYRDAARQLEEFRVLAATVDQNPVLADCYRAQERWADVEQLWAELSDASPSAELVNEGRIVMAGALGDQGELDAAVRLLEKGWKRPSRPQYHHLRRAYALADLYERSGNVPRARALFDWILKHDVEFVDTKRRLKNLR